MSERYIAGPWHNARELPGVGEYVGRSWDIFCQNNLGETPPVDHALVKYWLWRKSFDKRFDR
jgi:hypothetical protein